MKKLIRRYSITSVLLTIVLYLTGMNVYASNKYIQAECVDFNININNEIKTINNDVLAIDGKTYLPLREIAEYLELYVLWDEEERKIKISQIGILNNDEKDERKREKHSGVINVIETDFKVKINGYERKLDNPVIVYEGISYLPVREISELLNLEVNWEDTSKTVFITVPIEAAEADKFLLPFNINDTEADFLWGYMDKNGNVIIEPKYVEAGDFSDEMAYFQSNDGYGFININGDEVIPGIYDNVFNFSEGLAAVGTMNNNMIEYKFINKSGDAEIDGIFYREAFEDMEFHDGYAPVTVLRDKMENIYEHIYIDKNGNEKANFGECVISNFKNGFASVKDNFNNIKIINTDFETVIDFKNNKYDTSYDSYIIGDGFLTVRNNYMKWGVVDYNNILIIPFEYDYIGEYSEGLFCTGKYELGQMKYEFIDLNGNSIISGRDNIVDSFHSNVSFSLRNNINGDTYVDIMNKKGEIIKENVNVGIWLEPDKNIYPEGIRAFFNNKIKTYINKDGEYIVPLIK